ncbi:hypothetical protein ACFWHF_02720 [Streptomyces griseoincarnatus]
MSVRGADVGVDGTRRPGARATADLIAGMLHTALAAVESGAPLETVTRRTLALVRRCLVAQAGTEETPEGGR